MKALEEKKLALGAAIDKNREFLWETAMYIYQRPELAFHEVQASTYLSDLLEGEGFCVCRSMGGLETAFCASFGQGKPVIAILAEYDALPELGHGCGHNLIAASAIGAGIAIKNFLQQENISGTVRVIGTPAEEDGGGKILLIEQGVFADVEASMMMHPTSGTSRLAGPCLSSHEMKISFTGKTAHAESHPENGINALDALHVYYTAVACLRQQLPPDVRIAQIVTKGGISEAMIPDFTEISVDVVSEDRNLTATVEKIQRCAEGAALATGCNTQIAHKTGYLGRVNNLTLEKVFRQNALLIDEPLMDGMPEDFGTTDFGNVTRLMPCCNPYISIFIEKKITNHSQQFKELAASPRGQDAMIIASKLMAYSAAELFLIPEVLVTAKQEWEQTAKSV